MKNDCPTCDGFGVMTLTAGPGRAIEAPCLICSPTRNLYDLERERELHYQEIEREKERAEIREHNTRIAGL